MVTDGHTQTGTTPFVIALANLAGRYVTLSHRDGSKYDGVLHTFGLEDSGPGVELVVVTPRGALGAKAAKPEKRMLFHPADVVRIDCKYSLQDDLLGARAQALHEVRADTEISTGAHGKERQLQAWVEGADALPAAAVSLDDWDDASRKKEFAGWDQFAVNERQFGVTSTYDETLYTTRLDRRAVSKEAEAAAAKLAAEIEGMVANNALQAEERGQAVPESERYDEEARYSTVLQGADASAHLTVGAAGGSAAAAGAAGAAGGGAPGGTAAGAPAAAAAPAAASKSGLNPNAKSFSFNPKAKEFVPGGGGAGGGGLGGGVGGGGIGGTVGVGMGGMAAAMGMAGRQQLMASPAYGCGFVPGAAMMGGGFAGGPGGMPQGGGGHYPQMLRPGPGGGGGFVMGQPFGGAGPHGQPMGMGGMGGMGGVRGHQGYPMQPAPPGAQIIFPGGPQQMAALRAMQQAQAQQPGAGFAPYGMGGAQQQLPAGGGPPRFAGAQPGFGQPQPPRQNNFQPPRM